MDLTPTQTTTLCLLFVGFHVLALPPFLWAIRNGQFSGREQREWSLDDGDVQATATAAVPLTPRARWLLGFLATLAVLMLSSVGLVLFTALQATAHPATGKCPF